MNWRSVKIHLEDQFVLVVEFLTRDELVLVKKYKAMDTSFRFDVCNWLEGELPATEL